MDSKRKIASVFGRDDGDSRKSNTPRKEQDVPVVELDSTFGKLLGVDDGQKVCRALLIEESISV